MKARFREITQNLGTKVKETVEQQVALVEANLQILRDENVVLQSERDPEFRTRLAAEVESVQREVDRMGRVVGDVS